MQKSLPERVARLESVCNALRSEMDDVLKNAYDQAVADNNAEQAAELARKIRNRLLSASDKECVLDKVLPMAPSGTTFTSWLSWLKALANVNQSEWGVYRQALRDLPQQKGFPFNVKFPDPPSTEAEGESKEQ